MRAEAWMTRDVRTCDPRTNMDDAAHRMWQGDFGVLPVVDDGGRVVGMITDRDICMGAHFQGRPLAQMQVADSMSSAVVACHPRDPIELVLRRMRDARVRRVPVVDDAGRALGILSLNDLARHLVELSERERARLLPRFVEAMAAICETRACAAGTAPQPGTSGERSPAAVG